MRIAGIYSFNNGKEEVENNYAEELEEIKKVITSIDSSKCKTKSSEEKTMLGKELYAPRVLNTAFKRSFDIYGWEKHKEICDYSTDYYVDGYEPRRLKRSTSKPYREMDFLKNDVGVEVQFGKYAFMVYNVCAKMTIFNRFGLIKVGVEIVPVKSFADEMSTGVSYFEQFVWDLEHRGVSDIDIPVMILGIDAI